MALACGRIWQEDADVTADFFAAIDLVPPGSSLHLPDFDLLDGTRAMEVGNPIMDTGLIPFEPHDAQFDLTGELSLPQAAELQIELLVAFMSWLDNRSLPETVLGCRYVVHFLEIYQQTKLKQDSLQSLLQWGQSLRGTGPLYTLVGPFVAGLCKAIGIYIQVANSVLFEEEDITTRSLGLEFLHSISTHAVLLELDSAIETAKKLCLSGEAHAIQHTLIAVKLLVSLEYVTIFPLDLFGRNNLSTLNFLMQGERSMCELEKHGKSVVDLPPGVFSRFAQRYLSNSALPLPLYKTLRPKAFADLKKLFADTSRIILYASRLKSMHHMFQFLEFDIELEAHNLNALTRGVFQLFFIRDDRSVFGSRYNLRSITLYDVEASVGPQLGIFAMRATNSPCTLRIAAADLPTVMQTFDELVAALESVEFEAMYVYGSNSCRHHQLRSKSLVQLDSLQVRWEQFEFDMFNKYGIGEQTTSGEAAMPVSSFLYLRKLETMIKVLFCGVSLDLFRSHETYLAYWYISLLIDYELHHLDTRVRLILESRIHTIKTIMPKKIKKLKAGPKREAAKELLRYSTENIIPAVELTLTVMVDYIRQQLVALHQLVKGRTEILRIISAMGIGQFVMGPESSRTTHERLFGLRLKPFLSIGVPEVPSFAQYVASLSLPRGMSISQACVAVTNIVNHAGFLLQLVLSSIKANAVGYYRSETDNQPIVRAFEQYVSVIQDDLAVIAQLSKILAEEVPEMGLKYKLELEEGRHRYFPRLKIIKREP